MRCYLYQHPDLNEPVLETEDAVAFSKPDGKWHGRVHGTRDPLHQVTAEGGVLQMAVASAVSAPDYPAVAAPVQHTPILQSFFECRNRL